MKQDRIDFLVKHHKNKPGTIRDLLGHIQVLEAQQKWLWNKCNKEHQQVLDMKNRTKLQKLKDVFK